MPLDLGNVAGMRTKFQLYTVPGQVYYNSTRKLVLQGVDGVIFVADSDPEKMPENIESYQNLIDNLTEYGKDIRELPHVIQYNKRDLPNAMSVEEMDRQMNKFGVPTFEAVAYTGEGVFPTLKTLAGMVLESIDRMDSRSSKRPAAEAPRTAAPAARGAQPTRTAAPAAQKKPAAAPQRAAAAPATQRAAATPATRTAPAKAAAAAPATAATAKPKAPAARTPATPARTTPAAQAAPAARRPGMPAPRAAQPAPKKGGGMAMVVGLSVLLIAAAAGVVWFFSSNNLL
jgi:signal recognition particle receptor subunit beta